MSHTDCLLGLGLPSIGILEGVADNDDFHVLRMETCPGIIPKTDDAVGHFNRNTLVQIHEDVVQDRRAAPPATITPVSFINWLVSRPGSGSRRRPAAIASGLSSILAIFSANTYSSVEP